MREPKVYIIILNWNQKEDTGACLESLGTLDYGNYSVIVVDNGSTDGSIRYLESRFPKVTIIKNRENLGFVEGCNTGIRYAQDPDIEYILLLNNDMTVDKAMLGELISVAESDKEIAILGAVHYSFDKRDKVIQTGTDFNWFTGFVKRQDLKGIENGKVIEPQAIQGVSGGSFLIKKEVIDKIGLPDPRYFIYYEDIDWCRAAHRAGYKVLYIPRAKVYHKKETSFGGSKAPFLYLYTRNFPLFMRKNCPRIFLISVFVFYILKLLIRSLHFLMTGRIQECKAILYGFCDAVTGNYGKGRLDEFITKGSQK